MTTQLSDRIPYNPAAGHLAPDTDIEVKRVLCRNLPQICFQVSDKGNDIHLDAGQLVVVL